MIIYSNVKVTVSDYTLNRYASPMFLESYKENGYGFLVSGYKNAPVNFVTIAVLINKTYVLNSFLKTYCKIESLCDLCLLNIIKRVELFMNINDGVVNDI